MSIYNWLTNTQMDVYILGLWSIFFNSLIRTICSALHTFIWADVDFNESIKTILYIFIAVCSSIFVVKLRDCNCIRNILVKIGKRTIHADILDDVIDYDKRTIMTVYLKDSDVYYRGIFRLRDEKGSDSYISLINYISFSRSDDEEIFNPKDANLDASVIFNLHDVERIELFYEKNSQTWKWLGGNK